MKLRAPELPRWDVTALIGLSLPDRYTIQVGGVVTYRLVGPLKVGAWAVHGDGWAGGLAVGVTF